MRNLNVKQMDLVELKDNELKSTTGGYWQIVGAIGAVYYYLDQNWPSIKKGFSDGWNGK